MRKVFFFILFLLTGNAFAATYAVQRQDDTVAIHQYNENSSKSLEETLLEAGLSGLPYARVSEANLPRDISTRDCWRLSGGNVVVDDACIQSQERAMSKFDAKMFMPDLYESLSQESVLKLSPYAGALTSMIEFKNFLGVKELLGGLVAQGIMTAEEQTTIYQCFLDQGVDLTQL